MLQSSFYTERSNIICNTMLVLWNQRHLIWIPTTIKAVWGFNGTERPGAVCWQQFWQHMHSVVLLAFSIYGHDVQDANDTSIPADVAEKILRFARGAVAAGWMRNKAYVYRCSNYGNCEKLL